MSDAITKGNRAAQLLEDPVLQGAFVTVYNRIHQQFDELPPSTEAETFVRLKDRLHILESLKAELHQLVETGKFEQQDQDNVSFLGDKEWLKKQTQ